MTLAELREALGLKCTLPAIHYVLVDMGLTYKKRFCGQKAGVLIRAASCRASRSRTGCGCGS
jgi:hypothetical protein